MASSFHSRIADAVHEAKGTLSHTEAIVGRFAAWYTPTVLLLAAALGAYKGFDQFLVVIVAGCPCALLGAAPFVHGATLSLLASEHRLLIKHTNALESLARLTAFGFDKTGTLTTNQMVVEALVTSGDKAGKLEEYAVSGTNYSPLDGSIADYPGTAGNLATFAAVCSMCNEAEIKYPRPPSKR